MFFISPNPFESQTKHEHTSILIVEGLEHEDCARHAERALESAAGVARACVNPSTGLAIVRHTDVVSPAALAAAINAAGFHATLANPPSDAMKSGVSEIRDTIACRQFRFLACATLTAMLFVAGTLGPDNSWKLCLLFMLATPVQFAVGWDFYGDFFTALRNRRFNLDSLAVLASSAAFLQGLVCFLGQVTGDPGITRWTPQFHSAALLLTAASLGKWLEVLVDNDSAGTLIDRAASALIYAASSISLATLAFLFLPKALHASMEYDILRISTLRVVPALGSALMWVSTILVALNAARLALLYRQKKGSRTEPALLTTRQA